MMVEGLKLSHGLNPIEERLGSKQMGCASR
jgi:hypothetical protein